MKAEQENDTKKSRNLILYIAPKVDLLTTMAGRIQKPITKATMGIHQSKKVNAATKAANPATVPRSSKMTCAIGL